MGALGKIVFPRRILRIDITFDPRLHRQVAILTKWRVILAIYQNRIAHDLDYSSLAIGRLCSLATADLLGFAFRIRLQTSTGFCKN